MKVSISVGGRFHGFNMASFFQQKKVLHQLVTGYPKTIARQYGIDKKHVLSIYINEIINRLTNKLGLGYPFNFLACELYDYLTSKLIKKNSDVYFIWSGYGLKTIKAIRKTNPSAKIVLVRGSAHILEQEYLLKRINNTVAQQISSKMIVKEIAEYEISDYINVPSTFAVNSFIKHGFSSNKLFLNLLGVDLTEFPFKEKQTANIISLGYVGTISKQKNIENLILLVAKLNQDEIKFNLVLAGAIDYDSFDEKILNKHPFIHYHGKLPQQDLYKIYHQIDIFILNTIQDGFGMVLLQAMSCGCPIIATANSGGPDVIKPYENGILVPAMNDDALEKALIWFDENRSRIPEMGKNSRQISETNFTWKDYGERNLVFLNNILKE